MPNSAAGQVPGVPFQQRNYENWSYANEQKGCYWEMCPLFLFCTVKKINKKPIWWETTTLYL